MGIPGAAALLRLFVKGLRYIRQDRFDHRHLQLDSRGTEKLLSTTNNGPIRNGPHNE
jgi:hypothetical protein